MKEIFGWFPAENQILLDRLIKEHNVKSVIEIGSFLGKSSHFFAERVDRVTCIDPFKLTDEAVHYYPELREMVDSEDSFLDAFMANMEDVRDKVTVFRGTSKDAFLLNPDWKADLIYIDGSHIYEDVFRDIKMWDPRAIKVICGDDCDDNWPMVKDAVNTYFPKFTLNGRVWYKTQIYDTDPIKK